MTPTAELNAAPQTDYRDVVYQELKSRIHEELLNRLIGSIGSIEHVRCTDRGEGSCEWRADWTTINRAA